MAPLTPVEVLAAEVVDPAATAITAELEQLESELVELRTRADALERRVEETAGFSEQGQRAATMLECLLTDMVEAARADLQVALERARERGAERVSRARARADAVPTSGRGSDGGDVPTVRAKAGDRWPTPDEWDAVTGLHRWGTHLESPAVAGRASVPASPAPSAFEVTVAQQPVPEAPVPEAPVAAAPVAEDLVPADPVVATPSGPGPATNGAPGSGSPPESWSGPAAAKAAASRVLDIVLPLLAISMVVIVIVSWIG